MSGRNLNYHNLIKGLGDDLTIVVVGANDGVINDPLYSLMRDCPELASVFLVEPQPNLIEILSRNYEFHPRAKIINKAVGKPGRSALYTVCEDSWDKLHVPYATDGRWPTYRAPTGIVSFSRSRVTNWLTNYLSEGSPSDYVKKIPVEVQPLGAMLRGLLKNGRIDVLQVDAEGFDDEVIYNSDLCDLMPKLIFYESCHLSHNRKFRLENYLCHLQYDIYDQEDNSLAIFKGSYL